MEAAYVITATGTDAGKTFVAEGLARVWHGRGERVRALKPVLSGFDPSMLSSCDAGRLLAACGGKVTSDAVAAIAPWRYAAPLSPDAAAALEGRRIDVDALVRWCRDEVARNDGRLLIEGIGGVMVPLDGQRTTRDWFAALGLPVVLVAGSYLGALSHTLTALAALREAGVAPVMIVVNESAGSSVDLGQTLASLTPHANGIALASLCRDDDDGIARLADRLDAWAAGAAR